MWKGSMGMVCPNLNYVRIPKGVERFKLDGDEAGKFGACYVLTVLLAPRNGCFFCVCCMVALTSPWKGAKVFLLQHSTC